MRRLFSIFFLCLFLFNLGGYYLVFWAMKEKARNDLLARLEAEDYRFDETLVLTIPLSLPYPIHNGGYERVDGDFEHAGQIFKLVKQKVENDTLYIVCIRDYQSTKIASALQDYSRVAHNVPADSKSALNFLAKLYKDYNTSEFTLYYRSRLLYEQRFFVHNASLYRDHYLAVDSPPPNGRG